MGYKSLVVVLLASTLTACSGVNEVEQTAPMTLEEVAGSRLAQLSNDEKEGLIYKYVTDRITVDSERLITIESSDAQKIDAVMKKVDGKLSGQVTDALPDNYANYMLMEFARTPYEWEQTKVDSVGFDPAARLYFVDVTYATNGTLKSVVPSSRIATGSPNEEALKSKRYSDYLSYLTFKMEQDPRATQALQAFTKAWGTVESVKEEQQGVSLLERTKALAGTSSGVGKLTYSGLVNDSRFIDDATMTFRFVFKYKFNLGEETDMQVHSLYLKDYHTDTSEELLKTSGTDSNAGLEVLKPFIDKVILSYNKAVEESNNLGLYSLFTDYASLDKYYQDVHDYMYTTTGGYTYEIVSRRGTDVLVKVNRINQFRSIGSNMSLPTYDEVLLFDLELSNDDKIRIKSVNLVSSTLVGEPISVIKNVSGISDLIQYSGESFTDTNKKLVEEAVAKFSKVVFNASGGTSDFTSIVDIGVPEATMKKISDYVTAIPNADRKVTYLVSWNTKTNSYVSLTLREVFETKEGNYDTESVMDLANRDNEWKVVNYTRTLNIKSASASASSKNALAEDTR